MELTKASLRHYLELVERPNSEAVYGIDDVRGVNNQKLMIRTKADISSRDLTKFQIVMPGELFFNHRTSRNGSKFSITYNYDDVPHIVTEDYVVFRVANEGKLCPSWLYLYVCRNEYDRYVIQNSWGSSTEFFNWEDFCETEILLPPIEVQRKYVAIYEAMLANQRFYEQGLDDLKTICFSTIERFRREMPLKPIGNYVRTYNEKNSDGAITLEQGVNIQKQFITPQRPNSNLLGRKIVRHGQFAYCTQLNNANVAIAIREGCDCVVSSVYDVFEITKTDELLADYLMLWLIRPEFGRYVYWASVGSAYEFLSFENLANYKIPVPTIAEQKSVADIYQVYKKRYAINERLKSQLKDICPILIRGSIEEASR